jgi:hypothetical protein
MYDDNVSIYSHHVSTNTNTYVHIVAYIKVSIYNQMNETDLTNTKTQLLIYSSHS